MADSTGRRGRHQQQKQPSRLQRRAPASLQINRSTDWNVAIPLLSPLSSPPSNLTAEIESRRDVHQQAATTSSGSDQLNQSAVAAAAASFKKWQNPAAPFYYHPAPYVRVNGGASRS